MPMATIIKNHLLKPLVALALLLTSTESKPYSVLIHESTHQL